MALTVGGNTLEPQRKNVEEQSNPQPLGHLSFNGDPEHFLLASEAIQIKYSALRDPLAAVWSSTVIPLPHQLRAVYHDMLPQVPLRFLLADDPGAGKTIMAGLYIKEMILRSAARRIMIVCPGGLAEQWQDELKSKFDLDFPIFTSDMEPNAFTRHDRLICRMDQLARNDDYLQELKKENSFWDIVVVDEAHRMSASFKNVMGEVRKTHRFELGQILSQNCENLLLMTATPHSGSDENFRLFLSLLDPDRFAGRSPSANGTINTHGIMRRMVKEEMVDLQGKPLFPPRKAITVGYQLSLPEQSLYRHVTDYVRNGMTQADVIKRTDARRGNAIGFALTMLQRRLASSPEAILRSLQRRKNKIDNLISQVRKDPLGIQEILRNNMSQALNMPVNLDSVDADDDFWSTISENQQGEAENGIDQVIDSATAAQNLEDLERESDQLEGLVSEAQRLRNSHRDTKWAQLSSILSNRILNSDPTGYRHKLIIFTEHRDTLLYLVDRIRTLIGREESVVSIDGTMTHGQRKQAEKVFVENDDPLILVATDAAGEGINLQRADLMVNYDLPWNPNRIEQRFGRIHRIGQKHECFLWNLVAESTREGQVYQRLLSKIGRMGRAYQGRLFNVLGGKAFNGRPLKDLMLEAIRSSSKRSTGKIEQTLDMAIDEGMRKLTSEKLVDPEIVQKYARQAHVQIEQSRKDKILPGTISAFFNNAFRMLGGRLEPREKGRWAIPHIPFALNSFASRNGLSLDRSYERVCFDPILCHLKDHPDAVLIAPGTPLLTAVTGMIIDRFRQDLRRGAMLVDSTDRQTNEPWILQAMRGKIVDGTGTCVQQSLVYAGQSIKGNDRAWISQPSFFDYTACPTDTRTNLLSAHPPLLNTIGQSSLEHFLSHYLNDQMKEPIKAHKSWLEQTRKAVVSRCEQESEYWYGRYNLWSENEQNGRKAKRHDPRIAFRRAQGYESREKERTRKISLQEQLHLEAPTILGTALVFPSQWLSKEGIFNHNSSSNINKLFARETKLIDQRAMARTMAAERALGRAPQAMSHNNRGWDITSTDSKGNQYYIEVKGRISRRNVRTFTASYSEIIFAQNQGKRHRLSLVIVHPDKPADQDEIRYVRNAFNGVSIQQSINSINPSLPDYWSRGYDPFLLAKDGQKDE